MTKQIIHRCPWNRSTKTSFRKKNFGKKRKICKPSFRKGEPSQLACARSPLLVKPTSLFLPLWKFSETNQKRRSFEIEDLLVEGRKISKHSWQNAQLLGKIPQLCWERNCFNSTDLTHSFFNVCYVLCFFQLYVFLIFWQVQGYRTEKLSTLNCSCVLVYRY